MTFRVLDPTPEKAPPAGRLAPRLDTLEGKTIGFISNGKEGTKGFFGHLDRVLREEYGVAGPAARERERGGEIGEERWPAWIAGMVWTVRVCAEP